MSRGETTITIRYQMGRWVDRPIVYASVTRKLKARFEFPPGEDITKKLKAEVKFELESEGFMDRMVDQLVEKLRRKHEEDHGQVRD